MSSRVDMPADSHAHAPLAARQARTIPRQPSSFSSSPSAPPSPPRSTVEDDQHAEETRRRVPSAESPTEADTQGEGDKGAGRGHAAPMGRARAEHDEDDIGEEMGEEDLGADVEVAGSEGVLAIRGRELRFTKVAGKVVGTAEQVQLRDIQSVTSSAQGTIKIIGRQGVLLLEGPPLASFPMDELGAFFETVKARVSAAKRVRRTPPAPAPSSSSSPSSATQSSRSQSSSSGSRVSALRAASAGDGSEAQPARAQLLRGGSGSAEQEYDGHAVAGMEILEDDEEGGGVAVGAGADEEGEGDDEDGPVGWGEITCTHRCTRTRTRTRTCLCKPPLAARAWRVDSSLVGQTGEGEEEGEG